MASRTILPLLLLPLLPATPSSGEPGAVSRMFQPTFVSSIGEPEGVYHGKQKPWRRPRRLDPMPRATEAFLFIEPSAEPRAERSLFAAPGLAAVAVPVRFRLAPAEDFVLPMSAPGPRSRLSHGERLRREARFSRAVGESLVTATRGDAAWPEPTQEPEPAVGGGQVQPADAGLTAEPSLLEAIRGGADAPRLSDVMRFGVALDLYLPVTEADDSFGLYNEMRVRSARVDMEADVDRFTLLFASAEFGDVADQLLLREAGVELRELPGGRLTEGLSLRAGRFYADLGAFNTVLPGRYPAPEADFARQALFGGNLALTGVGLAHDLPFGWGHLHTSLALASEVESHGSGPWSGVVDQPAPIGRRNFDNATSTARASLQIDQNERVSWRLGASGLYTPDEVSFADDGMGGTLRVEQEHSLWGVDLGVLYRLPGSDSFHEVAFELWIDDREFDADGLTGISDPARGEALLYRLVQDEHWSLGVQLARADVPALIGTDPHISTHQAFVTYAVSAGNRLTLYTTHVNPGPGEQKFFTVGLEWALDVGTTRGGGIPRWRHSAITASAGAGHPISRLGN